MKKNKLKLIMLACLVVTITTGTLVGCSNKNATSKTEGADPENFNVEGMPIVNEPIEITALTQVDPLSKDYNEMEILKKFDEGTNVDVKYECVAGNVWEEKKNLTLASGKLPDVFFGGGISDSDIVKYGSMGMFVALEDYIDKYAPNIKKVFEENPEIKNQVTAADGHIYTLPYINGYKAESVVNHLFINKKWLDNVGLQVPKTTDEYTEVLKAFKEQDANGNGDVNDEVPLSFVAGNIYNGDYSLSGSFGIFDGKEHIMIKDDNVIFAPIEEGYKEYLKWANGLYKEGLLDNEIFTQEYSMYVGKGKDKTLGSFISFTAIPTVGLENADEYIALDPLVGPDGEQLWGEYPKENMGNKFVVTNANKNIEATIRWIDQFFDQEDDKAIEVHIGEVGVINELVDGKFKMVNDDNKAKWENCPGPYAPGIVSTKIYDEKMILSETQVLKNSLYDQYKPFLAEKLPILSFTKEELEAISVMNTDLSNFVDEMKAKWVTGQADIDKEWDGYVDRLYKMGLEEYIKIYKDAYERYKN